MDISSKGDFSKLNKFLLGLKTQHTLRVGVLGEKDARSDEGNSNATIGLVHELGSHSRNIPARSFLRMPITTKSDKILKNAVKDLLPKMAKGDSKAIYANIGFACEDVVLESFETGGFGKWEKLKAATIRRKGSARPLIDTSQLRRSILSRVD